MNNDENKTNEPKVTVKLTPVVNREGGIRLFEAMLEGVRKRRARRLLEEQQKPGK
jgi:hypothetical protein